MKELKDTLPLVIESKAEQKINIKKLGTIKRPINTIYEYCPIKEELKKAEFEESTTKGKANKLIISDNKIYVTALNEKNAFKKLLQKKYYFNTIKNNEKVNR